MCRAQRSIRQQSCVDVLVKLSSGQRGAWWWRIAGLVRSCCKARCFSATAGFLAMGASCSCRRHGRRGRYTTDEDAKPYHYTEPKPERIHISSVTTNVDRHRGAAPTSTPNTSSYLPVITITSPGGGRESFPTSPPALAAAKVSSAKSAAARSRSLKFSPSRHETPKKSPLDLHHASYDTGGKVTLGRRHTTQPPSMLVAARNTARLGNNYALNCASPRTLAFAVDYIGCDNEIPFRRGYLPTDESTIGALERQYTQRKPPYRQVVLVVSEERLTIFDSYDFNQVVHRLPMLDVVQVDARYDTITVVEDAQPGVRSCHVMRCRQASESHAVVNVISRAFHRAFSEYTAAKNVQGENLNEDKDRFVSASEPSLQEKLSRPVSMVDVFNVHRDLLVTPDEDARNEKTLMAFPSQETLDTADENANVDLSATGTQLNRKEVKVLPDGDAKPRLQRVMSTNAAVTATTKESQQDTKQEFSRDIYRHSIRIRKPGLLDTETGSLKRIEESDLGNKPTSPQDTNKNYMAMSYDELLDSVDTIMGTPVAILRLR